MRVGPRARGAGSGRAIAGDLRAAGARPPRRPALSARPGIGIRDDRQYVELLDGTQLRGAPCLIRGRRTSTSGWRATTPTSPNIRAASPGSRYDMGKALTDSGRVPEGLKLLEQALPVQERLAQRSPRCGRVPGHPGPCPDLHRHLATRSRPPGGGHEKLPAILQPSTSGWCASIPPSPITSHTRPAPSTVSAGS